MAMKRHGMTAYFEGMAWPVLSNELNELEWRLRYSAHEPDSDKLSAASIVSAYRALLLLPRRTLAKRITQLHAAARLYDSRPHPAHPDAPKGERP